MMSVEEITCFVAGAAVGAVLATIVVSHARAFPYDCRESGGFVYDNQYYECNPTGKWAE